MKRLVCLLSVITAFSLEAQTSLKVVSGRTNSPIAGATVTYTSELSKKKTVVYTNDSGYAVLNGCTGCRVNVYSMLHSELKQVQVENNMVITLQPITSIIKDVVVTGQHEQTSSSKSVQRIRIIDAKTIEKRAAVNLKDLLMTELNIKITQDNVLGSSLNIQGISGQNIKILQDGVPIIGRLDGNLDLGQINLSNIERVEIIEGPMSTIYGTDALGGVINLITKKNVKSSGFNFSNYYETVGTVNTNLGLNLKTGRSLIRLEGGRNYFDGYSQNYSPEVRWMQWKPKEQYSANVSYSLNLKKVNFRYTTQYFHEKITAKNIPIVTSVQAYAFDDYFTTQRFNHSLFADISLNKNNKLSLLNSYSTYAREKNRYRRDLVTMHDELTGPADQDTNKFFLVLSRAIYKTNINPKSSLQTGYDVNIETGKGGRLDGKRQQIQDYALFSTLEWNPYKRIIIKPGIRFIYNSRYGAPVIPSLNFKYFAGKNWDIKGAYSKGFRAPSLKELSLFFVDINHNIKGNSSLKAERSNNFNLSTTYNKTQKDFTTSFTAAAFYNILTDVIDLAIVDAQTQLYTYMNISDYKSLGTTMEASVKYKSISLAAGCGRTGRQNLNYKDYNIRQFNYANEFNASAGYYNHKAKAGVNVFYKFNGSVPQYVYNSDGTTTQSKITAYSLCDISFNKSFLKQKITFFAGAKNLFDIRNINIASSGGAHSGGGSMPVGMGRFYFLTLKINIENHASK